MLRNISVILYRSQIRNKATLSKVLKYNQFGEPDDVLLECTEELSEPQNNEVLLKILASPINPADVNTIQGKYPVKPLFPAVGGNEFVAEVISVGPESKCLKVNDKVIPFKTGLGVWRTFAKFPEEILLKVPKDIDIVSAATLTVNPCTAYRMLKDFKNLREGDTIIQNGANSGVGQAVHQLCKAWGINSVGIVRERPDIHELKNYLKSIGATEILTEQELRKTEIFKTKLKKPKIALNCVGGKNATEITRHLANKGILITYGGMSREPLTIPTAALIFKDLSFAGFWMTRWTEENFESQKRKDMFNDLFDLIRKEKLKPPIHELVPFGEYKNAMKKAFDFKGLAGKKFILDFTK